MIDINVEVIMKLKEIVSYMPTDYFFMKLSTPLSWVLYFSQTKEEM